MGIGKVTITSFEGGIGNVPVAEEPVNVHGEPLAPVRLAQADPRPNVRGYPNNREDFYRKYESTGFDFSHPSLKELAVRIRGASAVFNPRDMAIMANLYADTLGDKGKDYADRMLGDCYRSYVHGYGVSWGSIVNDILPTINALRSSGVARLAEIGDKLMTLVFSFAEKNLGSLKVEWNSISGLAGLFNEMKKGPDKTVQGAGLKLEQIVRAFVIDNLSDCPDNMKGFCKSVDDRETNLEKAGRYVEAGDDRLISKVWRTAVDKFGAKGAEGINEVYKTGELRIGREKGALKGFTVERIKVDGDEAAVLITGEPRLGALVDVEVAQGGLVTVKKIEERCPRTLQYQGPIAFQHGERLTQELTIYKGEPVRDLPPDSRRHHGYVVVFPDGRMRIVDKREMRVSELTGRPEDSGAPLIRLAEGGSGEDIIRFKDLIKGLGASVVPTMLVVKNGEPEWTYANGPDERRFLIEFGNGTFALLSTLVDGSVRMGINDMIVLAMRLGQDHGGVKNAVYMDTGQRDFASYYLYNDGSKKKITIGHRDPSTNDPNLPVDGNPCRLFFRSME